MVKEINLDSKNQYLKEISKFKVATGEENRELSRRYKTGDQEAFLEMYQRNLRLVVPYAKAYSNHYCCDFLDAVQDGNIGLGRAIELYDSEKGTAFSTYAVIFIKSAMDRSHLKNDQTVRLPVHREATNRKIRKYINQHVQNSGNIPDDEKMIEALGITLNDLEEFRKSFNLNTTSLNHKVGEEDSELGDFVPSQERHYFALEEELDKKILLYQLKKQLSPVEYYVIYYRIFSDPIIKFEQLADEVCLVTKQRIQDIEKQAYKKLERFFNYHKKEKISFKEIEKQPLEPYLKMGRLYLLKLTLSEEEFFFYYGVKVENKPLQNIFFSLPFTLLEKQELYHRALQQEKYIDSLSKEEKKALFPKKLFLSDLFNIDSVKTDNSLNYTYMSFQNMTYEEFIANYPLDEMKLSFKQIRLLQKFFNDSYDPQSLTSSEMEKRINLKITNFEYQKYLPIEKLYETYQKNKHSFSLEQQKLLEEKLFHTRILTSDLDTKSKQEIVYLIKKLERMYFNLPPLIGNHLRREDVEESLKVFEEEFTEQEVTIIKATYGLDDVNLTDEELCQLFSIELQTLRGKRRDLKERIINLKYHFKKDNSLKLDPSLYEPYLLNADYEMNEMARYLTTEVVLNGRDYTSLMKDVNKTRYQISNIVTDTIRQIDFYRFNILLTFHFDPQKYASFLNQEKIDEETKKIIEARYIDHQTVKELMKQTDLSEDEVNEILSKMKKKYIHFVLKSTKIQKEDVIKEVKCHITDSILTERERKICSLYYGIPTPENPQGLKISVSQMISEQFTEDMIRHILSHSKQKIKMKLNGFEQAIYGHISKEEIEVLLNDDRVPLTQEERNFLNDIKGTNGHKVHTQEEILKKYHYNKTSVLRKYYRAILTIKKYQVGEIEPRISYQQDIVPNKKYFSRFDEMALDILYKEEKSVADLSEALHLTKDEAFYVSSRVKQKIAKILSGDTDHLFDFAYARNVIEKEDFPLYMKDNTAITAYKLATGESGLKKLTIPDIIKQQNLDYGVTAVEKAIYEVMISVCKYRLGYRKEVQLSQEDIKSFYEKHKKSLTYLEAIKFERVLANHEKRILFSRNHRLDSVHYIILEKEGKLPFQGRKEQCIKILNLPDIHLSTKEREYLYQILGKTKRDSLTGREKLKVLKILKKIEEKKLDEKNDTKPYEKTLA